MKTATFHPETVASLLKRRKIATLGEIGEAMGSASERTVFRNLSRLAYLSSYTHRGKFYTLKSIARFSSDGLWSVRSVWFSRFGTLLDTVVAWVQRSEAGYDAAELTSALHVETKHALTRTVRQGRLQRDVTGNRYVYFAADYTTANQQRKRRDAHATASEATSMIVSNPDLALEEAKTALLLFFSMLNEKQRRLYAGLESLKIGHGGDVHMAKLFGIDPHTVARGRQELEAGDLDGQTMRAKGGGRLSQKKTPGIIRELERIMEDDTGGDPVKGCKWTHKTTGKVAEALKPVGIHVSANTVARLLKHMDYALRVNLKRLESGLSEP